MLSYYAMQPCSQDLYLTLSVLLEYIHFYKQNVIIIVMSTIAMVSALLEYYVFSKILAKHFLLFLMLLMHNQLIPNFKL